MEAQFKALEAKVGALNAKVEDLAATAKGVNHTDSISMQLIIAFFN